MRKITLLIISILLMFTACGTKTPQTDNDLSTVNESAPLDTVANYFPVKSNTFYMYECAEQPTINQEHYIAYAAVSADGVMRIQRRVSSGKVTSTEVLEVSENELRLAFGEPMFYFFEDLTAVTANLNMLILQGPLTVGQKWAPNESAQSEVTAVDVSVQTAAGSFNCLEITTTYPEQNYAQREYYSQGTGLIKTVYPSDEGIEYNLELTRVIEGKGMDIETVFYARAPEGLEEETRTITFGTNGDFVDIFNDAFAVRSASGVEWLPGGIQIKTIELDRTNDKVIVNIEGDTDDNLALQGIADTLGVFYDTVSADVICGGTTYNFSVVGNEEVSASESDAVSIG
ncbi:MAG: hypothetical protein LBL96_01420 [Clostridiales bacterium]|nr:hypothetical protein [Clostridiales bacterium]